MERESINKKITLIKGKYMEINMTKFIDDYLAREGITKERAEALRHKISETTSLSKFTEFEFNAIKTIKYIVFRKNILCNIKYWNKLHSFDVIIGGDSVNSKKPDPEGLNSILEQLNVSADEAVLIGDSPVDVATGKRAGVYTCIANFGLGFPGEIATANPDCSIECLSKLKEMFC